MKCVICGEPMEFKPVKKHDGLYYGTMVCPNCGRKELGLSKPGSRP